jgi:hypothetical protein
LIAEFQLKNLPIDIISNLCQRGGLDGNRFHCGNLSFEICGFRFRFRSPRAAAISFQRAIVVLSPTDGWTASITR